MEDKELGNFLYFSPASHHPLRTWSIKYAPIASHQKHKLFFHYFTMYVFVFFFSSNYEINKCTDDVIEEHWALWLDFHFIQEIDSKSPFFEQHLCTFVAPVFLWHLARPQGAVYLQLYKYKVYFRSFFRYPWCSKLSFPCWKGTLVANYI